MCALALTSVDKDTPLFRFRQERPYIVADVCRRVYRGYLGDARVDNARGLEYILNDVAYQEIERLNRERGPEEEIRSRSWWVNVSKNLTEMSEQKKRDILKDLIENYSGDIAGQFNPSVYKMTTEFLPLGLGLLFKAQDLQDISFGLKEMKQGIQQLRDLGDRLVIDGNTQRIQALAKKGTVLFVPTHSSNMDSILLGYSLYQAGLPPVTYGAGKNLFSNPMMSFFMHNLGAYKVDRRIKHLLYKEILKSYSQVLLERGYHSLFFPGGTRCRSNMVEQRLKLGLMGTAVSAYVRNLLEKKKDHRIFICPITINYNLVLEAESLIKDHLRSEGGKRYFLENDQFDQVSAIIRFVMNTVKMESTSVIRFGEPFDPFGNHVMEDGESYDLQGRRIDPIDYVRGAVSGEILIDPIRDQQYTRYLGNRVAESFKQNTVIMPTQLVSHVIFQIVRERFKQWDVYRLMRLAGEEVISWELLRKGVQSLLDVLKPMALEGKLCLSDFLLKSNAQRIAEEGVDYLRMFHTPSPIDFHKSGIMINRMEILYFYGNRMGCYDIPNHAWLTPLLQDQ